MILFNHINGRVLSIVNH